MTTDLTVRDRSQVGASSAYSEQQSLPLPRAITASDKAADGLRDRRWLPVALADSERDQVVAARNALERRLRPARRTAIIAMLTRLAAHYPGKVTDSDSFPVVLSDMAEDLAEFSEEQISEACREWRRTESWWPKSADLRGRLLVLQTYDREHHRRAQVLLGEAEPYRWERPASPDAGSNIFRIEEAYEALERGRQGGRGIG